jgi:hypothetical protein
MKKKYLLFAASVLTIVYQLDAVFVALQGQTFFSPRSQGTDAARDIVGWHEAINPVGKQGWYHAGAITPVYERSFRLYQIAEYFFGTRVLGISGSEVATRKDTDLLADYFGLSPKFQSVVTIQPQMQNYIADIAWYSGSDHFFASIHAPITWTKAVVDLEENVFDRGCSTPFPANYMDFQPVVAPYTCFSTAVKGTQSYGQVERLRSGKIGSPAAKWGCADVHINIGCHAIKNERGRFGIMARIVVPTGNRPTSTFLFEPIVGNGRHAELGFGITGASLLWEQDGEQRLDALIDANVMHFFKTHQKRSFDLVGTGTWQRVGNWGSRYILAKKFNDDGNYSGITLPLINVTTVPVDIRITIQVDMVLMLAYTYKDLGIDLGYDGWIRSKEHLSCPRFPEKTYALKGIQNVTGFGQLINTTQSKATINGNLLSDQALVVDMPSPVFIRQQDLNVYSAEAPLAYSHKIFWHIYKKWYEDCPVQTNLGIGAFVEFEGQVPNCVQSNRSSLSQWGIWIKAGVGYS